MIDSTNEEFPQIHDTLKKQAPNRLNLTPPKEIEIENEYAELPESHLDVDFDQLLKTRRQLQENVIMLPDDIDRAVSCLTPEQRDKVYYKAIGNILSKTNFFHDFMEAGIFIGLINGYGNEQIGNTYLKWVKPEELTT